MRILGDALLTIIIFLWRLQPWIHLNQLLGLSPQAWWWRRWLWQARLSRSLGGQRQSSRRRATQRDLSGSSSYLSIPLRCVHTGKRGSWGLLVTRMVLLSECFGCRAAEEPRSSRHALRQQGSRYAIRWVLREIYARR